MYQKHLKHLYRNVQLKELKNVKINLPDLKLLSYLLISLMRSLSSFSLASILVLTLSSSMSFCVRVLCSSLIFISLALLSTFNSSMFFINCSRIFSNRCFSLIKPLILFWISSICLLEEAWSKEMSSLSCPIYFSMSLDVFLSHLIFSSTIS